MINYNPKDKLEALVGFLIFIGIIMLIASGFIYLWTLEPIQSLLSNIGNFLINITRNISGFMSLALIIFIAAGILGIGTFLKEPELQELYLALTFLMWIISLSSIIILAFVSLSSPISVSVIIGTAFILFITPPFVLLAREGMCRLLGLIIADACHNPFNG